VSDTEPKTTATLHEPITGDAVGRIVATDERHRRWRLVLGANENFRGSTALGAEDRAIDQALNVLYDPSQKAGSRSGGLGASAPGIARWLGDIRKYFPASIVRVMQQDALERLNLRQMLLEREMLEAVHPDVHLAATLLALKNAIPQKTRETARQVVRRVVAELERRLAEPLRQAVSGSLHRASRSRRPRYNEIDWHRTIRRNLKHYQPDYKTVIPETRIGWARKRSSLRDVILCVDQSGSMASSIVYAGVFGAVLASIKSIKTRMIVFDTSVVDLTDDLEDPVDLLFATQLGGGTDIGQALSYCQANIQFPEQTILVLISDLYEGGSREQMVKRVASLVTSGVQLVALLALSDDGAPAFDHGVASTITSLGVPAFACTPDVFPELMAAAINREDIAQWAAARGIVASRGDQ
jgi:Mg-chelatase subunit ChlD